LQLLCQIYTSGVLRGPDYDCWGSVLSSSLPSFQSLKPIMMYYAELRATVSLARLWQSQGREAEAFEQLSEIYNWFTEGFDIKDLREAKSLLDELSAKVHLESVV
jgi:hypothetical protein